MEIAIAHAASRRPAGLDVGLDLKSPDLVINLLAQALEAFQQDGETTRECVQKTAELPGFLGESASSKSRKRLSSDRSVRAVGRYRVREMEKAL
jgi:hypothetical protein